MSMFEATVARVLAIVEQYLNLLVFIFTLQTFFYE